MRALGLIWAVVSAFAMGASAQEAFDPNSVFSDLPALEEEEGPLSSEPGDIVVLRGLDKITATTADFEAPLHEAMRFGSLTIVARYCRTRPPEETPETFVLMEVFDRTTDGRGMEMEPTRIFTGWMFASDPALNPLEHQVYDVWVIGCKYANASEPVAEASIE